MCDRRGALRRQAEQLIADLPDDRRSEFVRSLRDLVQPLMSGEQSADAKRVLALSIELQPDDVEGWYLQGQIDQAAGQVEQALTAYSRALELAPDSAGIRNSLAWTLATDPDEKHRDPPRAVELARQAVEISPAYGAYWNTLGVSLYRANDAKEAANALRKSVELYHDTHLSFNAYFLAMSSWQLGNPEEGVEWLHRANAWMDGHAPNDEELIRFRAEAETLLGSWDSTALAYTTALEKSPDKAELWRGRAVANHKVDKLDQALADYARAIELAPDDPVTLSLYSARAAIFHARNQDDEAMAELNTAVERWPSQWEVWARRGLDRSFAYRGFNQDDKALAELDEAITLWPNLWDAWVWRASFHYDHHHWKEAVADYDRALELNQGYWPAWHDWGIACAHLEQWDRAVEGYRRAAAMNAEGATPHTATTHNDLAWFLATCPNTAIRNGPQALEAAQKALAAAPDSAHILTTLGAAHYRSGDWSAAALELTKSNELAHESRLGHNGFFLAMAYWQMAETAKAAEWFAKAKEWTTTRRGDRKIPDSEGSLALQVIHTIRSAPAAAPRLHPPGDKAGRGGRTRGPGLG